MALTAKQKNDILFYLGFPGNTLDSTKQNYISTVAGRINGIDDDASTESRVRNLLERLEKHDERLDGAADRTTAVKVGDIELNPDEISNLKKERTRLVKELGRLIDLAPQNSCGVSFGVTV